MTALFLKILNDSIAAGWLILAVLLLRPLTKKAPRFVNLLLWGLVALRLLIPISLESSLSLIPSAETVPVIVEGEGVPTINSGIPVIDGVVNPLLSPSLPSDRQQSPLPFVTALWLVGMTAMVLYAVIGYLRLRRRVATAVLYQENIYQSENVASPFVLGLIRPKIYLPYCLSERERIHVVAHERAHVRRRDHLIKPFGFLLLTLHCFNPLMWLAYLLLCRDIELACDEKVIKELGHEARADYTEALLSCSIRRRTIVACPLAFGEVGVKARVKSVMSYRRPTFWIVLLSALLLATVAVCFLTNPKQEKEIDAPTEEETPEASVFVARIVSIGDKTLLVEPDKDSKEYKTVADRIYVTKPIDTQTDLFVGNTVWIEYVGPIVDAYPARISQVKKIRLAEAPAHSFEQILGALQSDGLAGEPITITDYVAAPDRAYGLDGVVQYAVSSGDKAGHGWRLAFIRNGAAYRVSQEWDESCVIAGRLSYLGDGTVMTYILDKDEDTTYLCKMTFTCDDAGEVNFVSEAEPIPDVGKLPLGLAFVTGDPIAVNPDRVRGTLYICLHAPL